MRYTDCCACTPNPKNDRHVCRLCRACRKKQPVISEAEMRMSQKRVFQRLQSVIKNTVGKNAQNTA